MGGGSEVVDAPFLPETQGLVDQNKPPKNENLTLKKGRTWTWNGDKDTLFYVPLWRWQQHGIAYTPYTHNFETSFKLLTSFQ